MGCGDSNDTLSGAPNLATPLKLQKRSFPKLAPIDLIETQDQRKIEMYHRYDLEEFPDSRNSPWAYFKLDIGPSCDAEHGDEDETNLHKDEEFTDKEHKSLMKELQKTYNICEINMQRWDFLNSSAKYGKFKKILEQQWSLTGFAIDLEPNSTPTQKHCDPDQAEQISKCLKNLKSLKYAGFLASMKPFPQ
jgi:hypothetical protein